MCVSLAASGTSSSSTDLPPGVHDEGAYEIANQGKRDLKAEALSISHMLTHLPKNPHCIVCARAKLENVKSRRQGGVENYEGKNFGEHVTADTIGLRGLKDRGIGNKNNAIVFFELWYRLD